MIFNLKFQHINIQIHTKIWNCSLRLPAKKSEKSNCFTVFIFFVLSMAWLFGYLYYFVVAFKNGIYLLFIFAVYYYLWRRYACIWEANAHFVYKKCNSFVTMTRRNCANEVFFDKFKCEFWAEWENYVCGAFCILKDHFTFAFFSFTFLCSLLKGVFFQHKCVRKIYVRWIAIYFIIVYAACI